MSGQQRELRRRMPSEVRVEVAFHELDELADPLIIGYPECSRWGLMLEPPDEHGQRWLQFTAHNIRLPVLDNRASSLAAARPVEVHGPAVHEVEVEMDSGVLANH